MIHKIKQDLNKKNKLDLKNFMNFNLEIKQYYGLNDNIIKIIYRLFGFSFLGFLHKFTFNLLNILESFLRKSFLIGDFYKRILESQYNRYIITKTFRGFRYKNKLPANGQRTKVNSRTSRKYKPVTISNKFSKDIFILKENYNKKLNLS